jgi:hypothetical protein
MRTRCEPVVFFANKPNRYNVAARVVVTAKPASSPAPWLWVGPRSLGKPIASGGAQALLGYGSWQNSPALHEVVPPLTHPSPVVMHVTAVVLFPQYVPFCMPGSVQPLGGAGHVQAALGYEPAHGLVAVHVVVPVVTTQPVVGSGPHVASTLPARQTVPPAPVEQSVGGGRQVHIALPLAPVHCLPVPHPTVEEMPRHPLTSLAQVTSVLASLQKVPVPVQMAGGVGQVQTPFTHGLAWGQLDVAVMFKQPSPSRPHVAIDVDDWQKLVPGWLQPMGGVGHVHAEFGGVPAQGFPAVHAVVPVMTTHPSEFVPQVTTSPGGAPRQALPAPPLQSAGGALHEQLADPKEPVHGFPVGQVTRLVMVRQLAPSRPHVATTLDDSQKVPCWLLHAVGAVVHEHDAVGWEPVHGLPTGHVTGVSL